MQIFLRSFLFNVSDEGNHINLFKSDLELFNPENDFLNGIHIFKGNQKYLQLIPCFLK